MADLAKVGDPVSCPVCGITSIVNGSHDTFLDSQPVALVDVSRTACSCSSVIVSGLAWFHINDCFAAVHGSMTANGGTVLAASTAKTGSPSNVTSALAAVQRAPNHVIYAGQRYGFQYDPSQPHLKGGMAFIAEPQAACVFAKSCKVPKGTTQAGTTTEPASNFGQIALLAPANDKSDSAGGSGSGDGSSRLLRPVVGSSIATSLSMWSWAIRAAGPVGAGAVATEAGGAAVAGGLALPTLATLVGVMLPNSVADGRLYQDQQIDPAQLAEAATRVRFQFRRDAMGTVQLYGIHTTPHGGEDRVPTTKAHWVNDKSAMEAHLDGLTITWTPNNGPVIMAPTTYPDVPERLPTVLVHPIPQGQDSQITHYPGRDAEDVTWQDIIISFPIDSGVPPLYLVFAKPAAQPLEVDIYGAFSGRPRNGLHVDHMPSKAALRRYLKTNVPGITNAKIDALLNLGASMSIPAKIHQKFSETYGWRNTQEKQFLDAGDLRGAVDSNFDAIKPYMLEEGFAETDLEDARTRMHKVNEEQGWY